MPGQQFTELDLTVTGPLRRTSACTQQSPYGDHQYQGQQDGNDLLHPRWDGVDVAPPSLMRPHGHPEDPPQLIELRPSGLCGGHDQGLCEHQRHGQPCRTDHGSHPDGPGSCARGEGLPGADGCHQGQTTHHNAGGLNDHVHGVREHAVGTGVPDPVVRQDQQGHGRAEHAEDHHSHQSQAHASHQGGSHQGHQDHGHQGRCDRNVESSEHNHRHHGQGSCDAQDPQRHGHHGGKGPDPCQNTRQAFPRRVVPTWGFGSGRKWHGSPSDQGALMPKQVFVGSRTLVNIVLSAETEKTRDAFRKFADQVLRSTWRCLVCCRASTNPGKLGT